MVELGIAKRSALLVATGVVLLTAWAVEEQTATTGEMSRSTAEVARTAEELRHLVGAFRR